MTLTELFEPISSRSKWMRFLGILLIVYGVFIALSIIGLVVAWIPIWLGLLLVRAADASKNLIITEDADYAVELSENIGKFIKITGIVALVWLVLAVITILVWIPLVIGFVTGAGANSVFDGI